MRERARRRRRATHRVLRVVGLVLAAAALALLGGGDGQAATGPSSLDGVYELTLTVEVFEGFEDEIPLLDVTVRDLEISGDLSGVINAATGRASGRAQLDGPEYVLDCRYTLRFAETGGEVAVSGSADCLVTWNEDGSENFAFGTLDGRRVSGGPAESVLADFDWAVPERYRLGRGEPDPSPGRWRVAFFVESSTSADGESYDAANDCLRDAAYRWRVDGRAAQMARTPVPELLDYAVVPTACHFRYDFAREGTYSVSLTIERKGRQLVEVSKKVTVQDWLIVGVGDSVASGEGNAPWSDRRCHRSPRSFQSLVADDIERRDGKTSVTFVHLACSGASIDAGLLGPYSGIELVPGSLPPQLDELRRLVGRREIDALLVSVGANDIGFGAIVEFCVDNPRCYAQRPGGPGEPTLDRVVAGRLEALPSRFARLAAQVRSIGVRDPRRVYVTEYFDPTRDGSGAFCKKILGVGGAKDGIAADEAAWAYGKVVLGLNSAVAEAASANHWQRVSGIRAGFRTHGFCSSTSWIVGLADSLRKQHGKDGVLHPNKQGHAAIAGRVAPLLVNDIWSGLDARPPALALVPGGASQSHATFDGEYEGTFVVRTSQTSGFPPGRELRLLWSVTNHRSSAPAPSTMSATIDATGRAVGTALFGGFLPCSFDIRFRAASSGVSVSGSGSCASGFVIGTISGRRVSGGGRGGG